MDLLAPLSLDELCCLDGKMLDAQLAHEAAGHRLTLHPDGPLADIAGVRSEINRLFFGERS